MSQSNLTYQIFFLSYPSLSLQVRWHYSSNTLHWRTWATGHVKLIQRIKKKQNPLSYWFMVCIMPNTIVIECNFLEKLQIFLSFHDFSAILILVKNLFYLFSFFRFLIQLIFLKRTAMKTYDVTKLYVIVVLVVALVYYFC